MCAPSGTLSTASAMLLTLSATVVRASSPTATSGRHYLFPNKKLMPPMETQEQKPVNGIIAGKGTLFTVRKLRIFVPWSSIFMP
jgi:hypothetical protein